MLLKTYIDDSADETQERAVVAGAYIGFYHQWNKLQQKWRKRLKRDGIRYFHTTDYYGLWGEFLKFRDREKYPKPTGSIAAKSVLDDLESIIHESGVMGVAVCIDMRLYREIREREPYAAAIFPEDAFEIALQSLAKMCAEIIRDENFHGPRRVAFICDDSNTSARIARVYADFKDTNPVLASFLGGLVHQDDKRFPQLQAADMMAHLAKGRFIEWLDDPNKQQFTNKTVLQERLKRLSVHKIGAWDRNYMLAVLAHEKQRRGVVAGV